MSRKTMTYKCRECGLEKTYHLDDLKGNKLVNMYWPEPHRWPPFVICGKCLKDRETNRMYPELKGPTEIVRCNNCYFEVEMPAVFEDGWNCPECGRFGLMEVVE